MSLCLTLSWLNGKKEKTLAGRVPLDNLSQPPQRTSAAFFRTTRQTDIWLLAGILLLMGLAFWMIFSEFGDVLLQRGPDSVAEMDQVAFTAETGVQLVVVAMTAGDGMIDIRFRVVDPDKAFVMHDWDNPPTIVDHDTGAELWRTRHDGAHDDDLHAGVIYSHIILNGSGLIERGERIDLRVGDIVLEDIPVQ